MGGKSFYEEHAKAAASIAVATKAVELEISRMSTSPTQSQLMMLDRKSVV